MRVLLQTPRDILHVWVEPKRMPILEYQRLTNVQLI
jgi:hypothetical protein